MNNLVVETPPKQEEDPSSSTPDPLLTLVQLPHAERCTGDCRSCRVSTVVEEYGQRFSRFHATEEQRKFTRQALGTQKTADEYVTTTVDQEKSLRQYELRVAGCHKAVNGVRAKLATMLSAARHTLDERIALERSQYVNDGKPFPDYPEVEPFPDATLEEIMASPRGKDTGRGWMTPTW